MAANMSQLAGQSLHFSLVKQQRKQRKNTLLGLTAGLCLLMYGLHSGSFQQPFSALLEIVWQKVQLQALSEQQHIQWYIFSELRAPRLIMAMLVGALLAMSGCAMQGLVRNPLADPGLIGISAGAAAAAASVMALAQHYPDVIGQANYVIAISAFIGALLAVWLVLLIARTPNGMAISTLILAGVAINALATTHIGAISYMADDDALRQMTYWTMGSLAGVNWSQVGFTGAFCVPLLLMFLYLRKALNLLALGENEAQCMGLNVARCKRMTLWLVAFSVALATALCGIIGFVGLVVPHICRSLFSANHRYLMPASGVLGAVLMLAADTVSRSMFAPLEIPIGIVTSAIGAPFFLYLLSRFKAGGLHA